MSIQRPAATGKLSSEYAKSVRAELVGLLLVAVGLLIYLVVREWQFPAVLVAAGVYLAAHTGAAYSHARGAVKAADHSPNAVRLPPRGL